MGKGRSQHTRNGQPNERGLSSIRINATSRENENHRKRHMNYVVPMSGARILLTSTKCDSQYVRVVHILGL
jgi:hypothetical protein